MKKSFHIKKICPLYLIISCTSHSIALLRAAFLSLPKASNLSFQEETFEQIKTNLKPNSSILYILIDIIFNLKRFLA